MNANQKSRRQISKFIAHNHRTARSALMIAAAGITAGLTATVTHAATYVFDPGLSASSGTDGSGNWDTTTGNWYNISGAALGPWSNSTADTAVFGAGGTGATVSVGTVNVGTLLFNTGSGSYNLSGGTITLGGSPAINASAGTTPVIGSVIAGTAGLFVTGPGNLTITGANTYSGTTGVANGTLTYAGAASGTASPTLDVGNTAGQAGTVVINTTGTLTYGTAFQVGDAGGSGAVFMNSGTVTSGSANYLMIGNSGYGYFQLSGGTLNDGTSINEGMRIGGAQNGLASGSVGSIGVLNVTGGTYNGQRYLALATGPGGIGQATFTGGIINQTQYRTLLGDNGNATTAISATLNIGTEAGGNAVFNAGSTVGGTCAILLFDGAHTANATLNFDSGTTVFSFSNAPGIEQGNPSTSGAPAALNFNGGLLQFNTGFGTQTAIASGNGLQGTVYNGGAIFNTASGVKATIAVPLVSPTGLGIYVPGGTLAVPNGSGGSGYIGTPAVVVSGAGTGATANAVVTNGAITGVTLTSPGQGYTLGSTVTFAFNGGGATTAAPTYSYTFGSTSDPNLTPNGTGGLTAQGAGTLVVTASNTYTGPTVISGGTLQIGTGGNLGATSSVSIASGALLNVNSTGTVTFPSPITGLGAVSQTAAATTTLKGSNTYTGPTTLTAGKFILAPGTSLGNTAITASSGATLYAQSSTGTVNIGSGSASITLGAGAGLSLVDGAITTLNLVNAAGNTALTLGTAGNTSSASLAFELGQSTVDNIAVTGNVSAVGSVLINVSTLASDTSITPGRYTLITAGSGLGTSNFTLGTGAVVIGSTGYALNLNGSTGTTEYLNVVQTGGVIATAYWAGAINSTWSTNNANATNWRTDASSNIDTGVTPSSVTNVYFSTSSPTAGNLSTVLSSNQSINSLTFNGNATAAVSISGSTLTINALGLSGNAVGNGITVASGESTTTINSNVVLGSSQTWTNNSTNPLVVNGAVSGSASLTEAGTGELVLAGSNTFNGGVNLSSGTLAINNATALGSGPLTIAGGSTIDNTSGVPVALTTNNTQAWNGNFTFTGTGDLNMGTGAVTIVGNETVTLTAGNLTVGGIIDGGLNYGLTVVGNGNLNLAGSSTYNGGTVVNGGSLSFIGASGFNGSNGIVGATSLDVAQQAGQTAVVNFNTSGTVNFNGNVTVSDSGPTSTVGSIGAINVINGNINVPAAGGINYVTIGNGGYGALTISGGSFTVGTATQSSGIRIGGASSTAVGVLLQTGGTLSTYRYLALGNAGAYAQATFTGGITNNIGFRAIVGDGTGPAIMNLGTQAGGTNVFNAGGGVIINGSGTATGTLNLDSGTLNLSSTGIYASVGTGTSTLNLNGAVIQAASNGLALIASTVANANVYNGGANFNVPTGLSSSVPANLTGATGGGIYAGASGGTFTVTGNSSVGYVGAPIVYQIQGGSGTGAMAIADVTGGVVTGITMTNPGQGYQAGDNLTFGITDGGFNTTASNFNYTLTAADVAPNNGGMTKTGGGSLTVSGTNTFTGNTLVKGGTLVVANPSALGPTGSAVLSGGGTLALGLVSQGASFSNYQINSNGVFTPTLSNNGTTLTLTSAAGSEATSAFNPIPVTVNDATGFVASFTYTHGTTGGQGSGADGVAFVIQNQSAGALGLPGGALGYTGANNVQTGGITSSVAADVNLFYDEIQTGGNGTFNNSSAVGGVATNSVPFISQYASSNVLVVYNGQTQTLTETITSTVTGDSYQLVSTGVDVAQLLGGTAGGSGTGFIGFTGGTGGVFDTQSVSNFVFGTTVAPLNSTAVAISNAVVVNAGSSGAIQLAPTVNYSSGSVGPITIGAGGSLAVSIGTPSAGVTRGVLTTPSVTFSNSASGTLDVAQNALDITGGSLAAANAQAASAYANGTWTGPGITSSVAATDSTHLTAVGVIQNNQSGSALYTTFDGVPVGAGDILVKYTYYGDANLDGSVNSADYALVDAGYLSHGSLTGWLNGDFNYDGVINGSDYTLIDNAFNMQSVSLASEIASPTAQIGASGTSAVPEPTTLGLISAGIFGLLGRRRRRSN